MGDQRNARTQRHGWHVCRVLLPARVAETDSLSQGTTAPAREERRCHHARASLRHGLIWRLVPALAAIGFVGVIAAYSLGYRYATLAYDRALFDSVVALAGQITLRNGELHVDLPPEALRRLEHDRRYGWRLFVEHASGRRSSTLFDFVLLP